jgi:hypothetical protein
MGLGGGGGGGYFGQQQREEREEMEEREGQDVSGSGSSEQQQQQQYTSAAEEGNGVGPATKGGIDGFESERGSGMPSQQQQQAQRSQTADLVVPPLPTVSRLGTPPVGEREHDGEGGEDRRESTAEGGDGLSPLALPIMLPPAYDEVTSAGEERVPSPGPSTAGSD